MTTPENTSTPENEPTHSNTPHQRPLPHHLSHTALRGLVRGAATAIGTILAGWLTTWTRDHL